MAWKLGAVSNFSLLLSLFSLFPQKVDDSNLQIAYYIASCQHFVRTLEPPSESAPPGSLVTYYPFINNVPKKCLLLSKPTGAYFEPKYSLICWSVVSGLRPPTNIFFTLK